MYALHLLGHKAYEEWDGAQYTVDFDPSTQKVAAVRAPDVPSPPLSSSFAGILFGLGLEGKAKGHCHYFPGASHLPKANLLTRLTLLAG